jgi:hypothetical protein
LQAYHNGMDMKHPSASVPLPSASNTKSEEQYALIHDEIYDALVFRGAVEGQVDLSKDDIVKELKQGIFIHDSPDKVLNFLLEECAVGVWRRHILDPLEEVGGTRLAFWRHYLADKVVEYVFTLETTHDLYNQAHTITLTSVRNKDLTSVAMKKLTDQDQIMKAGQKEG